MCSHRDLNASWAVLTSLASLSLSPLHCILPGHRGAFLQASLAPHSSSPAVSS